MKVLVALIFLFLTAVFAWFSTDCRDDDSLVTRHLSSDVARAEVGEVKLTKVAARIDHLDVVLTGTVPHGRRAIITKEIGKTLRAGRVINLLDEDVEPASLEMTSPIPATVFFQRKGEIMLLKGVVDNAITKKHLGDIASQLPGNPRVVNELGVSDQASPLPDARLIPGFGTAFMQEAKEGYFEWTDDSFVMRGEVKSSWAKDRIGEHVLPLLHGRSLENDLSVSALEPEGLICLISDHAGGPSQGVLRGTLGTAELRRKALRFAHDTDPEMIWSDELRVAPDSADFSTIAFPDHIRKFLTVRGRVFGGFSYDSNGLSIIGVTDEDENARLTEALESIRHNKPTAAEESVRHTSDEAHVSAEQSAHEIDHYSGTPQRVDIQSESTRSKDKQ